jgi:hypothetical protein
MRSRTLLLASAALCGLLLGPAGAWAAKKNSTFVADNVLWLPEVFETLSAGTADAVTTERDAESQVFKNVERALKKGDFSNLTRSELASILSLSNQNQSDRDLTPGDLSSSGPFAFAGLDRMVGVGVDGDTSFRVDLSQNLLPTLLSPTVEGGEITDYTALDEIYSIANVVKGKGGAKIAKNGISFDADTGELQVTLKKPFADKQFVNLILELDDGSGSAKRKGRKRASSGLPSFQVTFANMTNPLADEPISVTGSTSGGVTTSQAADVEGQIAFDRDDNRAFVVAVENATGIDLDSGDITDGNSSYTAVVTNGVLFKKFAVQVASGS